MSTTPQMSPLQQQGQQYGPQQQYGQQPFGQQQPFSPQQFGQQQPFGQQPFGPQQFGQQGPSTAPPQSQQQFGQRQFGQGIQGMVGQQQIPQHLQQQLQQLGQQQPFQHLLQQMGREQVPAAQAPEISTQAIQAGVATAFWDLVQPLPGQSPLLYLLIDNSWRVYVDPSDSTHDVVQEAFAFGQTVIGYFDSNNPSLLLAIVVTK
ncbi:hypothetical protein [Streptomyces sp. NPDC059009]|uniref:hypothetical protein n=1 Tax=Streptomyces sp. NPDC059009 TaxID=3346694 RepID=UPI0036AD4FD8